MLRLREYLQVEARKCCQYLGQELTCSLSISVEGIGEGAEDGSTRATLTKERQEHRAAVLKKILADHACRSKCQTSVELEIDKKVGQT